MGSIAEVGAGIDPFRFAATVSDARAAGTAGWCALGTNNCFLGHNWDLTDPTPIGAKVERSARGFVPPRELGVRISVRAPALPHDENRAEGMRLGSHFEPI